MNTTKIVKNTASAIAVTVALATGISSAGAFEQFDNAAISGQASDPAALASAFCAGKGFKGAESYALASFEQNGAKAGAAFAWVRCTFVAGAVARDATGGGVIGGTGPGGIYPSQEVRNALSDGLGRAQVGNSIGNAIGNGYQVGGDSGSGSGSGSGTGGPGGISIGPVSGTGVTPAYDL